MWPRQPRFDRHFIKMPSLLQLEHGAHGVVVSHPLSMREALGSIPSVSISCLNAASHACMLSITQFAHEHNGNALGWRLVSRMLTIMMTAAISAWHLAVTPCTSPLAC
jgi:hypothetical protein